MLLMQSKRKKSGIRETLNFFYTMNILQLVKNLYALLRIIPWITSFMFKGTHVTIIEYAEFQIPQFTIPSRFSGLARMCHFNYSAVSNPIF